MDHLFCLYECHGVVCFFFSFCCKDNIQFYLRHNGKCNDNNIEKESFNISVLSFQTKVSENSAYHKDYAIQYFMKCFPTDFLIYKLTVVRKNGSS